MKNILQIVTILFIGFLLHTITAWWFSIAIAGLLGGLLFGKNRSMWPVGLGGGLAGLLLWGGYSMWINIANEGIMATRIGLTFGGASAGSVVVLTALVGGLFCGAGSLLGGSLRNV